MSLDSTSNLHQNKINGFQRRNDGIYEFDSFRFDTSQLMLYRGLDEVPLPPKQAETLLALIESSGEIVSKHHLIERLWADTVVEESNLVQNIYVLRKVLGKTSDGRPMIETFRRRGYRFNGNLRFDRSEKAGTESEPDASSVAKSMKTDPEDMGPTGLVRRRRPINALLMAVVLGSSVVLLTSIGYFAYFAKGSRDGNLSIAVLPLKPIRAADSADIYELGVADALIFHLSSEKNLTVRPLGATRKFAGPEQDPTLAGRELQADFVLASSYQLMNGRIRVTTELIEVARGHVEKAFQIDKDASEIFLTQSAIADELSRNVLKTLGFSTAGLETLKLGTSSDEAYRLYIHGKLLTNQGVADDTIQAVTYFDRAIKLDPNFGRAYSGMARAYVWSQAFHGGLPEDEIRKANWAIEKALELDNSQADAYAARADLKIKQLDLKGAEDDLEIALRLEPNHDVARWLYATTLACRGQFDRAIEELDVAISIDPTATIYQRDRGRILYFGRRYEDAIVQLERSVELQKDFYPTYGLLINAYEMKGEVSKAYETLLRREERMNPTRVELYRKAFATDGWPRVRELIFEFSKQEGPKPGSNLYGLARQSSLMGKRDQAFAYLQAAADIKLFQLVILKVDPSMDNLRSDPRFDELIRRIGIW